jgi:hypothetical protein
MASDRRSMIHPQPTDRPAHLAHTHPPFSGDSRNQQRKENFSFIPLHGLFLAPMLLALPNKAASATPAFYP